MKAYLFPGQGTQYPGMGKDLILRSKLAKEYFHVANEILGYSISDKMFYGTAEELRQTIFAQPAIFLHSFILTQEMGSNFQPQMVAGHSIGEITALTAIDALDFESALKLISKRASAMQKICENESTGMVVVVGLYDIIVKDICEKIEGVVVPANYNALHQVVISGENDALEKACKLLSSGAKRIIRLPVAGAFHSPLMEPMAAEFKSAVESTNFKVPSCPIYQNVSGRPTKSIELIKKNLVRQITEPVMWRHTILHMIEDGATTFTEVGPGNFLKNLVKDITGKTWVKPLA